jgi:hypothetical protein
VYKVNPREWLYTPTDTAYHFDDQHIDEIYQEEELPTSFVVEPGAALDSLVEMVMMSPLFRNGNNN